MQFDSIVMDLTVRKSVYMKKSKTIIVDLDKVLVVSNTVLEEFILFIKKNPLRILHVFFWFIRGKQYFSKRLGSEVELNVKSLPYNKDLVEYLNVHSRNARVYLVSRSGEAKLRLIADYLKLFDGYESLNIKDSKMLEYLTSQYGEDFYYISSSSKGVKIWKKMGKGMEIKSVSLFRLSSNKVDLIKNKKSFLKIFFKQIRLFQWTKNFLVFLPAFLAYQFFDKESWGELMSAFLSFSLCASGVYILNDLVDLSADRNHFKKRERPLASGDFSIELALWLMPILLTSSVLIGFTINKFFLFCLLAYFVLTTLYTFHLKSTLLLDSTLIAILYTLRVFAGSQAAQIEISNWLLIFSIFFFFGLALVKRYSEIYNVQHIGKQKLRERGYFSQDLTMVGQIGSGTSLLSIVVMALYIQSEAKLVHYSRFQYLYFIIPILLYFVARIWILASRGVIKEDPFVFLVKDKVSYIVGFSVVIILFLSR